MKKQGRKARWESRVKSGMAYHDRKARWEYRVMSWMEKQGGKIMIEKQGGKAG